MNETKDFVKIKFYYWHEGVEAERIESIWASHRNENYRIENIPFYVKEFAYGDIISIKKVNGEIYVDELVEESGHSTIRIIFFNEEIVKEKREELSLLGCDSELSDKPFFIAVDVPPSINYQKTIKPYLEKGVDMDLWDFQEACLGAGHSPAVP